MYVRILSGTLRLGMWDEYEQWYYKNIEPLYSGLKGLHGRQLLRSMVNPDEGMSITYWDTIEDLQQYDRSPQRLEAAKGAEHLYTGEYSIRTFEIKSSTF